MKDKIIQKLNDYLRENTLRHTTYWYPLVEIKSGIPVSAFYTMDIYKDRQKILFQKNI